MKYLKTFETITNSIWNIEKFKKVWGFEPEDFEDYFVEMVDDLNLDAKVYWYTIGNNSLELKIEVPVEGNSDLHGWFDENIKPRLERIKSVLKTKYGIQYSGYQLGLTYQEGDQSFYYKLIWYKTSLLPLSKRNENYFDPYYEEISEEEFNSEEIGESLFDTHEIEQLTGLSSDLGYDEYRLFSGYYYGEWNRTFEWNDVLKVFLFKDKSEDSEYRVYIFKRLGEEFLVSKIIAYSLQDSEKLYYLCDGFDGLVKCLREIS